MAGEVPLDAPWKAPRAREWDGQTFETWKLANMPHRGGRGCCSPRREAVFAAEPRDVSLLHVLFYIHSAGGVDELVGTAGGAQESRFVGGSQLVSPPRREGARIAGGAERPGAADRPARPARGGGLADGVHVTARYVRGHGAAGAGRPDRLSTRRFPGGATSSRSGCRWAR